MQKVKLNQNKIKKGLLLSLAGSLLLVSACSSNRIKDHVVEVGNMGDVTITRMASVRINGLLVAEAAFHNEGKKAVQGYYRCQFYDANKMSVGDPEVWSPITIYPNEAQPIKCNATDLEAADFKVEFSNDASHVTVFSN